LDKASKSKEHGRDAAESLDEKSVGLMFILLRVLVATG